MFRTTTACVVALVTTLAILTSTPPSTVIACSGEPERFDDLVRAADIIAVVRVVSAGPAGNTQPTIQPTFTPFPEATSPPYPLEDLSGIGATVEVLEVLAGEPGARLVADMERRAVIENRERELEAVWPGLAVSCSVRFMTSSYVPGATYIALYRWTGTEYETMHLVDVTGDIIKDEYGLGVSVAAYDRYFAHVSANIERPIEGETDGYAFLVSPIGLPLDRFISAISSMRNEPRTLAPPRVGTGGLKRDR